LIDQVGVPDVDAIDGLPPAEALQQQRGATSTRSSVGSVTAVSNLLRMLYSRAGTYPPRQPMLYAEDFSPNTPQGACLACHGLGRRYDVTEQTLVPDPSLTIRQRAVAAWPPAWHGQNLRDILVTLGHDVDKPWRDLPEKDRNWILTTQAGAQTFQLELLELRTADIAISNDMLSCLDALRWGRADLHTLTPMVTPACATSSSAGVCADRTTRER